MFGLHVTESHDGYIGWRAIHQRGYVDIVPNRGSHHGSEESQDRLLKWVNKPMILPPLPKRKRPRKVTPWKQMTDAAKDMSGSDREPWEVRDGNFVLRCNPQASYGYLYIALYETTPEPQTPCPPQTTNVAATGLA
jgi:hypothetical protein